MVGLELKSANFSYNKCVLMSIIYKKKMVRKVQFVAALIAASGGEYKVNAFIR